MTEEEKEDIWVLTMALRQWKYLKDNKLIKKEKEKVQ